MGKDEVCQAEMRIEYPDPYNGRGDHRSDMRQEYSSAPYPCSPLAPGDCLLQQKSHAESKKDSCRNHHYRVIGRGQQRVQEERLVYENAEIGKTDKLGSR